MVILLVADHVNQAFGIEFLLAEPCGSQVLRHIDRCPVFAEQEFFIQAFVPEVGPDRTVFSLVQDTFFQAFLYHAFAEKVSVGFVINLVEVDAQTAVSGIEALVDPVVHLFP